MSVCQVMFKYKEEKFQIDSKNIPVKGQRSIKILGESEQTSHVNSTTWPMN